MIPEGQLIQYSLYLRIEAFLFSTTKQVRVFNRMLILYIPINITEMIFTGSKVQHYTGDTVLFTDD